MVHHYELECFVAVCFVIAVAKVTVRFEIFKECCPNQSHNPGGRGGTWPLIPPRWPPDPFPIFFSFSPHLFSCLTPYFDLDLEDRIPTFPHDIGSTIIPSLMAYGSVVRKIYNLISISLPSSPLIPNKEPMFCGVNTKWKTPSHSQHAFFSKTIHSKIAFIFNMFKGKGWD